MYLREYETTLGEAALPESPFSFSPECQALVKRRNAEKQRRVAVVGGGFGGLMAARWLGQSGFDVTIFEARNQVGGRVRSNSTFCKGRITEEGAELIGSFHTTWLGLAREYGLSVVSRMEPELYHQAQLDVKLTLGGRDLSMDEFFKLEKEMKTRVLEPMARDASQILFPAQPWLQPSLRSEDLKSVSDALTNRYGVSPDEPLWKMLEFRLVNDEVAPLDRMNFLGLLCKVRAGQDVRFLFENDKDEEKNKAKRRMRYWDELEIFRCADGCQALATKLAEDIKSKEFQDKYRAKTKLHLSTEVTHIDLSESKRPGVTLESRKVKDQRGEKLADGPPTSSHYDYVILAVPPNRWARMVFTPALWHPKNENEIGIMGMDPAVKFFTHVNDRFWIKQGAAPYGGTSKIGQVWEGTDNQIQVVLAKVPKPKGGVFEVKQRAVLSVFAGPILPGGNVPEPGDIIRELKRIYRGYPDHPKTLFSNWPAEPFIKTGYASPRLGQIFTIGRNLNKVFHNLLLFAGEHTRMDFFGYMEGALRSGERAAKRLMMHSCGLTEKPAPASQPRVAPSAAPGRAKTAA